jgi:hypothetical protein
MSLVVNPRKKGERHVGCKTKALSLCSLQCSLRIRSSPLVVSVIGRKCNLLSALSAEKEYLIFFFGNVNNKYSIEVLFRGINNSVLFTSASSFECSTTASSTKEYKLD